MEQLIGLGIFFGKAIILLATFVALVLFIVAIVQRTRMKPQLEITDWNENYDHLRLSLNSVLMEKKEFKNFTKAEKKRNRDGQRHLFILEFDGDIRASQVESLRHEITAILSVAKATDEVLLRLESPGGMVSPYGLAASQLARLRDANIPLTICIDKVAASGGYLMACVANRILAAPFAVVGSIGVVAQLPNFHKFLKKHDIDYQEVTAGEFKRTVSLFAEIQPSGMEKFRRELEDTHALFKSFVGVYRKQLNVEQVATGEHWYGQNALDLKLVDELRTSDDYLRSQAETAKILLVKYHHKKGLSEKISESLSIVLARTFERVSTDLSPKA